MNRAKKLLETMRQVRDELCEADKQRLWEYHAPEAPAAMDEITSAQERLGVRLSWEYEDFLLCANGWKCFYQNVDLFGTGDFESKAMEYARKLLETEVLYDESLSRIKDKLLPIAVSRTDKDLFVMVVTEDCAHGEVIWLAGGEIEVFSSFEEFFEEMIEYNREELGDMLHG